LQERSVSRTHATLLRTRRGVYIRDENSLLGTYVNDRRIRGPVRLRQGDLIRIGVYQVFEYRER
jgi:pSer/pThr/pTyr-binding forkhead associated (FHA) protein